MRFGQGVSAFEFDGVLRSQYEERIGQRARRAEQGDGAFLHGFEQGRLRLGRSAIDFVSQQEIGEDRPRMKFHRAPSISLFLQDMRAEDVARHQVGRELYALGVEVEQLAEGFDERGFAYAGQPFEQDVAATQDAREDKAMQCGASEQDAVELGKYLLG